MKLLLRIKAALAAARAAFIHHDLMFEPHFSVMSSMHENILRVQEENRPLMFHIGFVVPENKHHAIATVWVGAGADSSPVKRIEELYNENQELRRKIEQFGPNFTE